MTPSLFRLKPYAFIALIVILPFSWVLSAQPSVLFTGGTGEPNDPYQIATAEQLIGLGEDPNLYDKHFVLVADIDLDPNLPGRKVFDRAVIAPIAKNAPWEHQFTGFFDGNGHKISNLKTEGVVDLGLFGILWHDATITDLGLEAVDVNCGGLVAGALVALCLNSTIINCYSTGTVSGYNKGGQISGSFGGLIGFVDSSVINNSHCTGVVRGHWDVGGLVGTNLWGSLNSCHSTSTVIGGVDVGGLVGQNNSGCITSCYSDGTVSGEIEVGGLVGNNWGSISNSFTTCAVNGEQAIGGLIGLNLEDSNITNCYSAGTVTGIRVVGGLVGRNVGCIANSYSTGAVVGKEAVGGLVGQNFKRLIRCRDNIVFTYGSITESFWDIQTSGQTNSDGGMGLNTNELQWANTFLGAGWDFVDETDNGPKDIWKIVEGQTYPLLYWQKYGGGMGEPNKPYLIYTAEHLNDLGAEPNDYDKHFKLMADIDLSGYTYDRAVIAPGFYSEPRCFRKLCAPFAGGDPFCGSFNGNGHTILNLKIVGTPYTLIQSSEGALKLLGLFDILDSEATVQNLRLENARISYIDDNYHVYISGGLVGYNAGDILNCAYTGIVEGTERAGGLVAYHVSGSIRRSFTDGIIKGVLIEGGLVGVCLGGIIEDSYSTMDFQIEEASGGFIGHTYSQCCVRNCYSVTYSAENSMKGGLIGGTSIKAQVGTSFWDTETSLVFTSAGGTGLTTVEMQDINTYLEAGWDFINETDNGTEDIWYIPENDYPRLSWELFKTMN